MFNFAETTKDLTAAEILNYYRNLYYAEPQVTERGIVANAINDFFNETVPKSEFEKLKGALKAEEMHTEATMKDVHKAIQNAKAEAVKSVLKDVRQVLLNMVLANAMGEELDVDKCFAEIEKRHTKGVAPAVTEENNLGPK